MTIFKLMNPCWILSSITSFAAAVFVFVFFGYLGKSHVFAKQHDITKWESLGVASFWAMDKTFFIFGAIFFLIIIWVLYVLRFIWDLLFDPEKRKAETRKDLLLKVLKIHDNDRMERKRKLKKQRRNDSLNTIV